MENFIKKTSKLTNTETMPPIKKFNGSMILSTIELIMPLDSNKNITENLINSFELSIYKKNIENIKININRYSNLSQLEVLLKTKNKPGKIFIGTLNSEATKVVKNYCDKGIIFFSFAANKNLAEDCVYLINFFPEDDLIALFDYFPNESKIALLFPENYYGLNINKAIDVIAAKSNSLVINRVSYNEDLTNARSAIMELGKYKLRKDELQRQKKILENKDDEISKRALKKIEKFETIGDVEFTHLILPDYSIRLLEIAPLLPFYDVDPNKVQFVGTGVWDESIFFNEPSLQGAIFSGIEESERVDFFDDYAHHPTEIKVVLDGVKNVYKDYEKVCIFQPHRISRLKDLKKEFTHAFKGADKVILFPIYTAGEKIKLGFSYLNFSKEIIKNSKVKLFLIDDKFQLAKYIKNNIYGKKIIIGMGAGTISTWMRELPKLL